MEGVEGEEVSNGSDGATGSFRHCLEGGFIPRLKGVGSDGDGDCCVCIRRGT